MTSVKIVIGPPFCNQGEYIKKGIHYSNDAFVTTAHEIKTIIENNESISIKPYKDIVVFGFNGTKRERDDIINRLKYVFDDLSEEYLFLDISQEKLLYKMHLDGNTDILALYIFYDCLEVPENVKINTIHVKTEYDDLIETGSSAIIIDIHPLLLNSTNSRIMLNLPEEDIIFINNSLCDYLKSLSESGFLIILSHCENGKYYDWNFHDIIDIYNKIFEKLNFDVSGFGITVNKNVDDKYYKPHPNHLFDIFKNYHINPVASFYVGYQEIDRKFAEFAGIRNYIDCSTPKKVGELEKHFASLV